VRIIIIDNYDSFTFNLVQALGSLGAEVEVRRNDVPLPKLELLAPDRIVLSPGPKRPCDTGVCADVVRRFAGELPILGVCLGHQLIAELFGAEVVQGRVVHGKTSSVTHDGRGVFRGIPSPFDAMRYHSLVVRRVPEGFEETARSDDGELMGLRNSDRLLEGVQFHPESYRTPAGPALLKNFLYYL